MSNPSNKNNVKDKSYRFALRIVKLYQYLTKSKKEFVLSKQILRSGTSVGANITEAICAQSKKDFISKFSIAYKETSETSYWLALLHDSEYLSPSEFESISTDCEELLKILTKILKTSKSS